MKPARIREILTSECNRLRLSDQVNAKQAGMALFDFTEYASEADLIRIRELLVTREPAQRALTDKQIALMAEIDRYRGQGEIMVATSRHSWSHPDAPVYAKEWDPVAFAESGTLHGLMAKGKIRIATSYWRGMTIEVL